MTKERSRAVIVTHVGDPNLSGFWLRFYKKFWEDEVDKVYFRLNGHSMSQKITDYYTDKFSNYPKFDFKVLPGNDHGYGLKSAVENCTEDYIMFMEDDAWVFRKGVLGEQFKKLESGEYEVLGSPRTSIDMKIYAAQVKLQPELQCVDNHGVGDTGTNFWPNFFFVTKKALMKTDLKFWGQSFKKGDYIKEIDYTVEEDGAGMDTGSWISMQLRAQVDPKKIGTIPQYKAYPHDPDLAVAKQWTFAGDAGWLHAGSISSGVNRYLQYEGCPLRDFYKSNGTKQRVEFSDEELSSKGDIAMRICFFVLCLVWSRPEVEGMNDFRKAYIAAIKALRKRADINPREIDKRLKIYGELLGLEKWEQ